LTDSDIIFPPEFKSLISNLQDNNLYSLPRAFCQNENQFNRYLAHIKSGKSHNTGVDRRAGPDIAGIGYMQLFKFRKDIRMSEDFGHAGKSDHLFVSENFKRKGGKCINLKEGKYCVHLGATGTNWKGRHSREWKI